jgi:hypothetical protein
MLLHDAALELRAGGITKAEWCDQVHAILEARYPDDPACRRELAPDVVQWGLDLRTSSATQTLSPAAA